MLDFYQANQIISLLSLIVFVVFSDYIIIIGQISFLPLCLFSSPSLRLTQLQTSSNDLINELTRYNCHFSLASYIETYAHRM